MTRWSTRLMVTLVLWALCVSSVDARRSKSVDRMAEFRPKTLFASTRALLPKVPKGKSPKSDTVDVTCQIRAGACSDADATVLSKVGVSAAVETAVLLGLFYAAKEVAENTSIGKLGGLPISYWVSILTVVFGSSFFGSFVDGGISAATDQALDPNVVPGDPNWYAKLKKPSWNPPGWLFPIMWLIVSKPTQAVALSKLLQSTSIQWDVLAVYCAHLSLGDAWNKVFFGFQCTGKGAAVISFFFGMLLTSAYLFYGVDPAAGKFLLPTCGWVTVATALNWNIYLNN